jgi:hypothetical protein
MIIETKLAATGGSKAHSYVTTSTVSCLITFKEGIIIAVLLVYVLNSQNATSKNPWLLKHGQSSMV